MLRVRDKELRFGERTFLMGIVNVTPDSFSGDGVLDPEQAVALALQHLESGADLIDVGGQSTRPGHTPIDEHTEIDRVIDVIRRLRRQTSAIISIDTFSPKVFLAARAFGADILNAGWGLTEALAQVLRDDPCPMVIMHNKEVADYPMGVLEEVCGSLLTQANRALDLGLQQEQIILDPGIGFGKTADQNLEVLAGMRQVANLGFPTLIGASRKSTIGKIIGRDVQNRAWGTAATTALAVANGVDIVRVHDVATSLDVVRVSDAIVRGWRPDDWNQSS